VQASVPGCKGDFEGGDSPCVPGWAGPGETSVSAAPKSCARCWLFKPTGGRASLRGQERKVGGNRRGVSEGMEVSM